MHTILTNRRCRSTAKYNLKKNNAKRDIIVLYRVFQLLLQLSVKSCMTKIFSMRTRALVKTLPKI